MFKLILKDPITGTLEEKEFETAKLARIYRDYHLNFGHWQGKASWKREDKVVPEDRRFIIDEMTKLEDGQIYRYYHVTDGLIIEGYKGESKEGFEDMRSKRLEKLLESDWTQIADVAMPQDKRKQYRAYRQYLRDLPSLHNEESILSAEVYSYEEWLLGKR